MGLFGSKNKEKQGGSVNATVTLGDGQSYAIANSVDCMGDNCPRPQLMTKKALTNAASEDLIEVLVDNPTSMEALPPMCPALAATHLETVSGDSGWRVYIRKN